MTTITAPAPPAPADDTIGQVRLDDVDINAVLPCECGCHDGRDTWPPRWRHMRPCGHHANLCIPCRFTIEMAALAGVELRCPVAGCDVQIPPPLDWRRL